MSLETGEFRGSPREALARVARQVKYHLERAGNAGNVPLVRLRAESSEKPHPQGIAPVPAGALAELAAQTEACRQCGLAQGRKRAIFGEGDPGAALVLIGEAPGAEEDREGRPMAGEPDKLLTQILAAIGLKRSGVYLCNLLKCRTPGNRNPLPEEIAACRPHLLRQLELLSPRVICTLGGFAAQALLGTEEGLPALREKAHAHRGVPVVPTLHPAALLYHPQHKRQVWDDMRKIAGMLKLPILKNKATKESNAGQ